jgi:hypothetical protein
MTRYIEGGGAPTSESADHHHHQSLTKDQHQKGNAAHRHIGRYTCGWRDGFTAGAIDALRLAARRLPPEAWNVLDKLADQYALAVRDE